MQLKHTPPCVAEMPRSTTKPTISQHFTDAEQGVMNSMCPTWAPTSANVELLGTMFKGRHTAEAILAEFAFFQERDIEWAARCAVDKSQGSANPETVHRTSQSPNILPLFTFTPKDTQDLYEAGVRLLKWSQKDTPNQLPSNNTSVHRHTFCELINFEETKAGKAFQRLLAKH